jgi:hypothetical protein
MPEVQRRLDAVFTAMEANEFGTQRHALLFLPGTYDLDVNVGFSTQVLGLGTVPDEVVIRGAVHCDALWDKGNATRNFWRGVENLAVEPTTGADRWAVSQASPYRRVHLKGDLVLDHGGWASGGFLADCVIDGEVRSGTQQQWLTRNSRLGGWVGHNWNQVFVGVEGAPSGEAWPEPPYTTLDATAVRDKPFLCVQGDDWGVMVPGWRKAPGPSWSPGPAPATFVALDRFHIVRAGDTADSMNRALDEGRHLLMTPGVYGLEEELRVTVPGTLVLGLGFPTLVPQVGGRALAVADVDGVTVAGLVFDAGPVESAVLVEVGTPGCQLDHSANPTVLHDLFFRVGGATLGRSVASLAIHSRHVVGDHFWLWRADHGFAGTVGWGLNTAARGLVVTGDDVTVSGLFVEHYQEHQVFWSGNRGRVTFYQSEVPYDPPDQAAYRHEGRDGWASYKVADGVSDHEVWGLGIYCYFRTNPQVRLENAVESPELPGIGVHRVTTVSLGGGVGEIGHAWNGRGEPAKSGQTRARWKGIRDA